MARRICSLSSTPLSLLDFAQAFALLIVRSRSCSDCEVSSTHDNIHTLVYLINRCSASAEADLTPTEVRRSLRKVSDYETIRALCWAFLVGSQFSACYRPQRSGWLLYHSSSLMSQGCCSCRNSTLSNLRSWERFRGPSYYAVPIHSVSIALAFAWWLLRGLPRSLGKRWASRDQLWVVAVPASGLVVDCIPSKFMSSVEAAVLAVIVQLGVIGLFAVGPVQVTKLAQVVLDYFVPIAKQPAPPAERPTNDGATISPPDRWTDATQSIGQSAGKKIFLSYRREDSGDVTGRIYDHLVQRFSEQQVFKDVDSIPLGVDYRKHLHQVLESCDVVVAVIGDRWNGRVGTDTNTRLDDAKDYVRIELEAALQRDILVIPVLVRGAQIPAETELPTTLAALAYRNGLPVRPDPDFRRDMARLIEGVLGHFGEQ